jgi:hypothetical protein
MDRRGFLKLLGIGTAAAAVAPQLLVETKAKKTGWHTTKLTPKMIAARNELSFQPATPGRYMYVRIAPKTMPFRVGDLVRYKTGAKETLAFRSRSLEGKEEFAVAICDASPGNYAWIQISGPDATVMRLSDGSMKAIYDAG